MNGWLGLVRPAYSLRAHVPARAARTLMRAMSKAHGRIWITPHPVDPDTGLQPVTIDTDGPLTHHQVRSLLQDRLGADLVHLTDPALATAATGKTTQRLCVPTDHDRDLALLDRDADHRVTAHLMLNPHAVDDLSGRRRRIALVSNATAVLTLGAMPAPLVLPALESAAVHLRRATGLDIHPMPLDADTPEALATAAKALAPGFAALCIAHTRPEHTAAVRDALADGPTAVVDTVLAHAVATIAAALNALRHRGTAPADATVVLSGAHRGWDLVGLLHALGVGELVLHDPATSHPCLSGAADLVVDLTGRIETPPDGTTLLHADPRDLPLLHATNLRPHPLHTLPALLTAAARGDRPGAGALLAAARTLADLADDGLLLPPVDLPGLPQTLITALTED
ncbi:hypothetical protein [Streptomyces sp. NRRL B-24484]|uniref:hypothetical protein n=1 Tax=Streptomyces sp. NRRL B-24484 TaxID=1463833 RepID=UPI000693B896|nr:hypothetical protein [Streptomyces sp. NRRL B-24484]